MATTTYVPTPQTDEQPPPSGRNWKTIAGIIALVAMLIGCVVLVFALINENKETPTPTPPISNEAQVREQAYKDAEPVVRAFDAAGQSNTVPATGLTDRMEKIFRDSIEAQKNDGFKYTGKDTLISVTPVEYRKNAAGEPETLFRTCSTVGTQVIDKSGKNVRVMPNGSPAPPGSKIGSTVTVTKVQGNEWLVDDATVDGPC